MSGYHRLHAATRLITWLLSRRHIIDAEHLERAGVYIMAGNHLHLLDATNAFSATPLSKRFTPLVADKWGRNAFTRWFLKDSHPVYLDRENIDRDALKSILATLKAGRCVGIAPEGTRSKSGAMAAAKPGVAWLARAAGVPIIPLAQWGTEKMGFLKRPDVYIKFGAPIFIAREDNLETKTDELMRTIAAMLPAQYRGVYA